MGRGAKSTNFVISTGFSKDFGMGKSKYAKALIIETQERPDVEVSGVYRNGKRKAHAEFSVAQE